MSEQDRRNAIEFWLSVTNAGFATGSFSFSPSFLAELAPANTITLVDGAPDLLLGMFDVGELGYDVQEFFVSGIARAHSSMPEQRGGENDNGELTSQAPFNSRMVVVRPRDPAEFNGTVLVEWLNVTGGNDTPACWYLTHREILRSGYAYVGVSAQAIGIEGGKALAGQSLGLKGRNPRRYGTLAHPGDAYSFDIYSQFGEVLRSAHSNGALGKLTPQRLLAIGESQSASFLTTYINSYDYRAKAYDGFLVHSRFASAAGLDGTWALESDASEQVVRFRDNLRVPVLTYITETDLIGGQMRGYFWARQRETDNLRVWETAGTSHADNYIFAGALNDDGQQPLAGLAQVFLPSCKFPSGELDKPGNPGMVHHYSVEAAVAALAEWVKHELAPSQTPLLDVSVQADGSLSPNVDCHGLTTGGVRTPWVDVPTMRLSGVGNSGSFVARLAGTAELLDESTLETLYPGGRREYLQRFEESLECAISRGNLLAQDKAEILYIAALNYDPAP